MIENFNDQGGDSGKHGDRPTIRREFIVEADSDEQAKANGDIPKNGDIHPSHNGYVAIDFEEPKDIGGGRWSVGVVYGTDSDVPTVIQGE